MYIIQTNRSRIDFQSFMYEIENMSWEEFKKLVISGKDITIFTKYDNFLVHNGKIVKQNCEIKVLINDERHLSVELKDSFRTISEYSLVNEVR